MQSARFDGVMRLPASMNDPDMLHTHECHRKNSEHLLSASKNGNALNHLAKSNLDYKSV